MQSVVPTLYLNMVYERERHSMLRWHAALPHCLTALASTPDLWNTSILGCPQDQNLSHSQVEASQSSSQLLLQLRSFSWAE